MPLAKPALLAAIAAIALSGATPPPAPVTALEEYEHARSTAKAVLDSTRALLMRELQARGPAGAIGACSAVAMAVARDCEQEGWRVRRVSLKLRNPADAPDAWEKKVLKQWESRHRRVPLPPDEERAEVVDRDGRRSLRYMRPIVATEACVNCHGPVTSLSPDVRRMLGQLYPKDRAVGYRPGDLRGAISVSIPMEATP